MLTLTAGVRISEALGVQINDIDFGKQMINITGQVGRKIDDSGIENQTLYSQRIKPKSKAGVRQIPLANFVFDEIILAIGRYNQKKADNPDFLDLGFISCQDNGKPYYKNSVIYHKYKHIYDIAGIPYLRWHDMRHTYATLLYQNNISLKAIANYMGHSSEQITKDVYIEQPLEIYDAVEEIESFIDELYSDENYDTNNEVTLELMDNIADQFLN